MILLSFRSLGISLEVLSIRPFELGNESVWNLPVVLGRFKNAQIMQLLGYKTIFSR